LYLAMQALCDPGDIVLVERPSYFVYLEMLKGLGVEARSLPDRNGELDLAGLRQMLATMRADGSIGRLKAVYLVTYFANPSGRSRSEEEKIGVGAALIEADVPAVLIEDAAYRELHYQEGYPARSILALEGLEALPRLYLGTLTKPYATGLKVGFACCTDEGLRKRMLYLKGHQDFGTSNFCQAIIEWALAAGRFDQHLQKIRPSYRGKMQALHRALVGGGLPELGWSWSEPDGGLYLWLEAPAGLDTSMDSPFCQRCLSEGVLYVPGDLCFGDRAPRNTVRLSFGVLSEAQLAEAGGRFCRAAKAF
jgi:2-aminoadipate transaminase